MPANHLSSCWKPHGSGNGTGCSCCGWELTSTAAAAKTLPCCTWRLGRARRFFLKVPHGSHRFPSIAGKSKGHQAAKTRTGPGNEYNPAFSVGVGQPNGFTALSASAGSGFWGGQSAPKARSSSCTCGSSRQRRFEKMPPWIFLVYFHH